MRLPAALLLASVATALAGVAAAAQIDTATFNALRRGMPESEVLARAGEPDLITAPGGQVLARGAFGGAVLDSGPRILYHYVPEPGAHDPWLTIVTFTNGRVSALERRKLFAPVAAPPPRMEDRPAPEPPRDEDVLRERADRTLDAAERYSEVRSRIKERSGAIPPPPEREIYHGTDEHGTPYYGDRPPPEPPDGDR